MDENGLIDEPGHMTHHEQELLARITALRAQLAEVERERDDLGESLMSQMDIARAERDALRARLAAGVTISDRAARELRLYQEWAKVPTLDELVNRICCQWVADRERALGNVDYAREWEEDEGASEAEHAAQPSGDGGSHETVTLIDSEGEWQ